MRDPPLHIYHSRVAPTASTWKTDHTADDEQRQIISLLQELQLAMESPSLLSVPPEGTVLYLGTAEKEVGAALSHLCVALEKCLFFGAEGSMPDFWWVLDRASEGGAASSSAAASGGCGGGGGGGGGGDGGREGPSLDAKGKDVDDGGNSGGAGDVRATKPPEPLATTIHRLTRVHTGHARCRAWARGLLGMEGASAEGELRKAAASVVHLPTTRATPDEPALRSETGDSESEKVHAAVGALPSVEAENIDTSTSESDPDAGGGVGRSVGTKFPAAAATAMATAAAAAAAAASVDLPTNPRGHDRPPSPPPTPLPSSLLPLWLRSNAKGSSVLDDVCRSLVAFSRALDERGLSIRPSLDHAWLDQESLAAVTTYTWPRFRRARLRCYVRGAGLSAANGEYLPADAGEAEGGGNNGGATGDHDLTLLGPNGCKICRKAGGASVGQRALLSAAVVANAAANLAGGSTAESISGRVVTNGETGTAASPATTTSSQQDDEAAKTAPADLSAPVARLWHLLVPEAESSGLEATKTAYFCLGDGPLPPSRGWRSAGEAEAPAPVLRFATQADDGGFVSPGIGRDEREDRQQARVAGEERSDDTALFGAAVPPGDVGVVAAEASSAVGTEAVAAGASVDPEAMHGSNTSVGPAEAVGRRRLKRRRKRRRPAEGVQDVVSSVRREYSIQDEPVVLPQGRYAHVGSAVESESAVVESDAKACGGGGDYDGRDRAGGGSSASADDDKYTGCEGGDEAVAAFKAERWRLPEPSGELLARVERSRELLRRTVEVCTAVNLSRRA